MPSWPAGPPLSRACSTSTGEAIWWARCFNTTRLGAPRVHTSTTAAAANTRFPPPRPEENQKKHKKPHHTHSKRQTLPFKVCYAMAWPTLGGGTMLAVIPEESQVERRIMESPAELERRRASNAAAIALLRSGGGGGGGGVGAADLRQQQQQQKREDSGGAGGGGGLRRSGES